MVYILFVCAIYTYLTSFAMEVYLFYLLENFFRTFYICFFRLLLLVIHFISHQIVFSV